MKSHKPYIAMAIVALGLAFLATGCSVNISTCLLYTSPSPRDCS